MGRIERLLKRQDVDGLIKRLDKKDRGSASLALTMLGTAAVPALIEELKGPEDKAAAAANVLISIGAPALHGLAYHVDIDDYSEFAGVAIAGIRKRGIPLTDECLEALRQTSSYYHPSNAAERRELYIGHGMTGQELDEREAKDSKVYIAAVHALGELAVEDGKLVLA